MILGRAVLGYVDEGLRRELQDVGHDREVDVQRAQRPFRGEALQVGKLEQPWVALFGGKPKRGGTHEGLSGAQNTPATSSPRAKRVSRTLMPKACRPVIAMRMLLP